MSRNIRTLGDFRNDGGRDSSGEESDGEERQGFYVGGSEHSGQQVLGPNRDGDPREAILQAARRAGAEELREEPQPSQGMPSHFRGSGARLGRTGDDHEFVGSSSAQNDEAREGSDVVVRLNMWENGFSIDDGPLRALEDPANQQFLTDIMQGRIPRELSDAHPRSVIDLRLERKNGPYQAPKPKPFAGTGNRLGGVVPTVVSNVMPQLSQQDAEDALAKAQSEVQLDTNGAVTQVQIRMQDGKRLVGKFNHSHTLSAIRTFIVTARPELAFSEFQLMTTFPNKIVDDETQSLADAGLLNSVIVVKPVA